MTKEIFKKLYSLSHDVIWDVEATREIEGKSFIMPNDLNRITELIDDIADDIADDIEKVIDQTKKETREETIKEIEKELYCGGQLIIKDGEIIKQEHFYNKLKK